MKPAIRLSRFATLPRVLAVAALSFATTAVPAQAGFFDCMFTGNCYGGGGDNGGNTPPDAEPTGVIHTVYLVGSGAFPDVLHVAYGDTIMFHNLQYSSVKIEATDGSWTSDTINRNYNWSFVVQPGTALSFRKKSYGWGYSNELRGDIKIEDVPDRVAYGDLIDYNGYIVGKDGRDVRQADGLGRTLAAISGTKRKVGNGLALGLTTSLGLGNN